MGSPGPGNSDRQPRQGKLPFVGGDESEDRVDWASRWNEGGDNISNVLSEVTTLDQLREISLDCERCGLREGCKQVVFGEGDENADLAFIGEAPGATEDREGVPFVGRAGQLLNGMLEAADLQREDVYITNVVKCRPPGNRTPRREERAACMPFLKHQMHLIQPTIIISLGAAATQSLIDPKARITRMRGSWQSWEGTKVMPMFHPAALLRDPNKKKPTWQDMKTVLEEIECE